MGLAIYMYKTLAIGGTFDRLHKGHEFFVSQAFKLGSKVIIGLTSDKFVEKKLKAQSLKLKAKVKSYRERENELKNFLKQENFLSRTTIVSIDDVYGPAAEANDIEALVVTVETLKGAALINDKRIKKGLKVLEVVIIDLVNAQDKQRISSTRIRKGEIDRWGEVLFKHIPSNQTVSESLRQKLRRPLGTLIKGNPEHIEAIIPQLKICIQRLTPTIISTVGDEVTRLFKGIDMPVHLSVVDFLVNRIPRYTSLTEHGFTKEELLDMTSKNAIEQVTNEPGHVSEELINSIAKAYQSIITDGEFRAIRVIGEEDLAGIPAILLAPLGSVVIYGQPGEGIVVVEVTEGIKDKLMKIMKESK